MTAFLEGSSPDHVSPAREPDAVAWNRPADRAALRVSRIVALLGLLGLASFALVFLRLSEDWRVTPSVSHHVTVFGQSLSYPAANAAAFVLLALAGLGAVATALAVWAIAREVLIARRLASRLAELHPSLTDGVWLIEDEHPAAFCAGLLRPRIYLTSGAAAVLDGPQLRAVLFHERHHARRRDPLRLALVRVITRSLFFVPAVRDLREGQQLLAELGADERAVDGLAGDRSVLAEAMLSLGDASEPEGALAIDPARVDALAGEPPSWRLPTLMCVAAAALLAVIVTVAILVGREAAGTATLAPPFLSAQPCIVLLALTPCAAAVVVALLVRSRRRGRGPVAPR